MPQFFGPDPPAHFVDNGCTCAPDVWGDIDLQPACRYHDYAYSLGGTEAERHRADNQFFLNLRKLGLPIPIASLYYNRVRFWGYFAWKHTVKPSFWYPVRLFFKRYIED